MDLINQITSSDLFSRLAKALLASEHKDFQTIDDSGGDAGNDGYSESQKTLFQFYCPEKPEKANNAKYKSKIKKDLDKAKKLLDSGKYIIKDWVFVTPRELCEPVQTYLRTEATARGMNGIVWSGTTLKGLFAKHSHLRSQFPELIQPDIEAQVGGIAKRLDLRNLETFELIDARTKVRVLVHEAFFPNNPEPFYFVKVVNLSPDVDFTITHIWVKDGLKEIEILNPERPLPKKLDKTDVWETWFLKSMVNDHNKVFKNVHIVLSNGKEYKSKKNKTVRPIGCVAGRDN